MYKMWLLSNKVVFMNSYVWCSVWFFSILFIRKAGKVKEDRFVEESFDFINVKFYRKNIEDES